MLELHDKMKKSKKLELMILLSYRIVFIVFFFYFL